MQGVPPKGAEQERRTHPRVDAAVPIVLDVELHGFDEQDARFRASGHTVNVSRGGLLAELDRDVQAGVRCLAHFPRAQGVLGRTMVYGVVSRCQRREAAYRVAVTFDTPLLAVALEEATERE